MFSRKLKILKNLHFLGKSIVYSKFLCIFALETNNIQI